MNDLIEMCEKVLELAKEGATIEAAWVDDIVKNRIESPQMIEGILDRLLDYSLWGYGEKAFHKLNNYYRGFCPKGADFYERMYREIE